MPQRIPKPDLISLAQRNPTSIDLLVVGCAQTVLGQTWSGPDSANYINYNSDSTKSNQVTSSTMSYDTRVAGVISEQPGIALGEKGDGKVLVATTGRVRVKVDATRSPIHIGDLLVTSDISGVAMRSEPVELGGRKMHMPGTLIGKALEPLEKGKGEVLVLLSLQ